MPDLNMPCAKRAICTDAPVAGLSAEGADECRFIGLYFPPIDPELVTEDIATACGSACCSTISQEDADLCAARLAQACQGNRACNEEQSCCIACPDGSEFCYTVPPCTIFARTVAEANAIASSLACIRAKEVAMCIAGALPDTCLGSIYEGVLRVTGGSGNLGWQVVGGVLPPGMTLTVSSDGRTGTVSGTATTPGSYEFSVRVVDQFGNFMVRHFQVSVVNITTNSIPTAIKNQAFSFPIQAAGGGQPYTFVIVTGSLPPGLTLASNGTLSGTPTLAGNYIFTVQITDSSPS